MRRKQVHQFARKAHRYLGVIIGIQFLFWTVGGLYFSWTNIKEIRGDNIRKEEAALIVDSCVVSRAKALDEVKRKDTLIKLKSIQLIAIGSVTYYQINFDNGYRLKSRLVNASTGELKEPLTQKEAVDLAIAHLKQPEVPAGVQYITAPAADHEYRDKPLPAYAVTFKGRLNTTVYVAAEMGTVQSFRNNQWRVFDFLWMLHVADFKSRDNINNWLLRILSALGLVTLLSGYLLYFISVKKVKQRKIESLNAI